MTFGLYKHYKGGWYLGLWKVLERTNAYQRDQDLVLYFSLKKRTFYVRDAREFFSELKVFESASSNHFHYAFRFKKWRLFGEACYCRELGAYETCPKHGRPEYGNHAVLKRFDGREHEEPLNLPRYGGLKEHK